MKQGSSTTDFADMKRIRECYTFILPKINNLEEMEKFIERCKLQNGIKGKKQKIFYSLGSLMSINEKFLNTVKSSSTILNMHWNQDVPVRHRRFKILSCHCSSSGHCSGAGWSPGSRTSTCHRSGPKKFLNKIKFKK